MAVKLQTIQELKKYCSLRRIPLMKLRFFIGKDVPDKKAFGIYKEDDGTCVVYKNMSDGERAVRYQGPDEAFAVNQIYMKLIEECHKEGIRPDLTDEREGVTSVSSLGFSDKVKAFFSNSSGLFVSILLAILAAVVFTIPYLLPIVLTIFLIPFGLYHIIKKKDWKAGGIVCWGIFTAICTVICVFMIMVFYETFRFKQGYYRYDDGVYYHAGATWYTSDENVDWHSAENQDLLNDNVTSDNFYAKEYNAELGVPDFYESECYNTIKANEEAANNMFNNVTGFVSPPNQE